MNLRRRLLSQAALICVVILVVEAIAIGVLYETAFEEEKRRLEETAKSQARLIEAVARFDEAYSADYPGGAREATLSQLREAHARYQGFGATGEFTLAKREGDRIVFLLNHRHQELDRQATVPWGSGLAEPMQMALSGKSGALVGHDYRGDRVLAAYEPVAGLDLGIVVKIDLSEIRAPFVRAGLTIGLLSVVVVGLGAILYFRITNPIIVSLRNAVAKLEKALAEVKTLRGILPICSFCKKVRDDKGSWTQVEVYVSKRSDADFSHGVCPECLKIHYPQEYESLRARREAAPQR